MEPIEKLNKKQRQRRLVVRNEISALLTEKMVKLGDEKTQLRNGITGNSRLDEKIDRKMSKPQLDDWIRIYSQALAEALATADQIRAKLKLLSSYKAEKAKKSRP